MNKNFTKIVLTASGLIIFIIIFSWLVLLPSKIDAFDFTGNSIANIGTAISGLSTPILMLFSSYLLYLALTKQTEANENQKLKNDVDFVLMLFVQLENEYQNLKYIVRGTRSSKEVPERFETIHDGYDAVYALGHFFYTNPNRFSVDSNTDKIKAIVNSYLLVSRMVENVNTESGVKQILVDKIESFYLIKLRDPLRILCFGIRNNNDLNSKYMLDFFLTKEKAINSNFDLNTIENIKGMFPADEYQHIS